MSTSLYVIFHGEHILRVFDDFMVSCFQEQLVKKDGIRGGNMENSRKITSKFDSEVEKVSTW